MANVQTIDPPSPPQSEVECRLLDRLDRRLHEHLAVIEQSEVLRMMADERATREQTMSMMKYIMLEVYSYGKDIVEASFTAIGRMPLDAVGLMRSATHHLLEEVTHPHMALRDYVKLGGDERWARKRRMSPESFAMAATCRLLAQREDPFAYLGFMYLFETLTPVLSERALKVLAAKQVPMEGQTFIDLHAVEDIKHIEWLRDLIGRVVRKYPSAESAIEYGFDCFRAVYPLPVWKAALRNVMADATRR